MNLYNLNKNKSFDIRKFDNYFILIIVFLGSFFVSLSYPIYNDDAFITLRYVKNLVTWKEIAYNPGERILGTTTPLFMFITAIPAYLGLDVIFSAKLLCSLSLALSNILILLLFQKIWNTPASLAIAVAYTFNPSIYNHWGNEIPLFFFILLLCMWLLVNGRFVVAGVASGLLYLCRGEGILLTNILFCFLLFDYRKQIRSVMNFKSPTVQFIIPCIVIIGGWSIFSYLYFGAIFPNTLGIKRLQALYGGEMFHSYLSGLKQIVISHSRGEIFEAFAWCFLPLLVTGSFPFLISLKNSMVLKIIFLFIFLQIVGYIILNVPGNYGWYYSSLCFLESILIGGFVFSPMLFIRHEKLFRRNLLIVLQICFFLLVVQLFYHANRNPYFEQRYILYRKTSELLNQRLSYDSKILVNEIGILGYYLPCKVYDTFGLVHNKMPRDYNFLSLKFFIETIVPDFVVTYYINKNQRREFKAILSKFNYTELYKIYNKSINFNLMIFKNENNP